MRILLLNQCFHPDNVATAQQLSSLAQGLVQAGHQVTAVASSRGYDNPTRRFPSHERWNGVDIHRIWTPGLGKKSKWRRLVDFASFWISATLILLRLPRFDVTICLTSPPLISSLGTAVAALKGGAVIPWIMDLNPDEAVAAGWLKQGGVTERILSALQNWSFSRAAKIVVLDRIMAQRLREKGVPEHMLYVLAPWSYEDVVHYSAERGAAFRATHGLTGKYVVMYSGNHSPCHPLDTVLESARLLSSDDRIHFVFIGGGSEFLKVKKFAQEHQLKNILCLPYQPLEMLDASLSSADLHLVVMGDPFAGIVHPCKVYNILLLGRPFLAICPAECHLADLATEVADPNYARCLRHGDAKSMTAFVSDSAQRGPLLSLDVSRNLGLRFGSQQLRPKFIKMLEDTVKAA